MAINARTRKFYIGVSSGASYTWLAGEQSNNVSLSDSLIETSDKSSAWQSFISGTKGLTASVTAYAADDSAQQKQCLDALVAGTSVFVFVGELSGTTPSSGYAFEALVASISETNDNGSASSRDFSLTATGEPTIYPSE